MSYKNKSFHEREKYMGDTAEEVFITYCYQHDFKFAHFGWDRPDLNLFYSLPLVIRYTPDYIMESQTHCFVEVKGFGKDGQIKLKDDNLRALRWWDKILPVKIFIYDVINKSCVLVSLIQTLNTRGRDFKIYKDNRKKYWLYQPHEFEDWITI